MDTKDKIENTDFEMSGSLNMAYVTEIHATIPPLYGLSLTLIGTLKPKPKQLLDQNLSKTWNLEIK